MDTSLVTSEDSYVEMKVRAGAAQGMSVSHQKPFQRMILNRPDINAKVPLEVEVDKFTQLFRDRVLGLIAGE